MTNVMGRDRRTRYHPISAAGFFEPLASLVSLNAGIRRGLLRFSLAAPERISPARFGRLPAHGRPFSRETRQWRRCSPSRPMAALYHGRKEWSSISFSQWGEWGELLTGMIFLFLGPRPVAFPAISLGPRSEIEKVIGIAQQLQHHIRHRRIELAALVGLNLIENVLLGKLFPVNPV